MMRVLVVEDDESVGSALASALARHGYEVRRAGTGAETLAADPVDIVLLDLGLPDIDGITLCRRLRAETDIPIVAVTAHGEQHSRVRGLRSGADDYIVKPYALAELLARMEAVLRRTSPARGHAGTFTVGGLVVDRGSRTVTLNGRPLDLTRKEFDLVALLARESPSVVHRDRILMEVWNTTFEGASNTLTVHVASLRSKLGRSDLIHTVRGVGYRLGNQN